MKLLRITDGRMLLAIAFALSGNVILMSLAVVWVVWCLWEFTAEYPEYQTELNQLAKADEPAQRLRDAIPPDTRTVTVSAADLEALLELFDLQMLRR